MFHVEINPDVRNVNKRLPCYYIQLSLRQGSFFLFHIQEATMIEPYNLTVPYVPVKDFDWSFNRTGPLPWNQTVWYTNLETS